LVQAVEVEGARPQRSLEAGPAGGRARVVDEGGGAEEAFLGNLALVGALGQVGVSLARMAALRATDGDPVAGGHHGSSLYTPTTSGRPSATLARYMPDVLKLQAISPAGETAITPPSPPIFVSLRWITSSAAACSASPLCSTRAQT